MPPAGLLVPHMLQTRVCPPSANWNPGLAYDAHFLHQNGPSASMLPKGTSSSPSQMSAIGWMMIPRGNPLCFRVFPLEGTWAMVALMYLGLALPSSIAMKGTPADGGRSPLFVWYYSITPHLTLSSFSSSFGLGGSHALTPVEAGAEGYMFGSYPLMSCGTCCWYWSCSCILAICWFTT